jgi:hypothetical protein
MNESTFLREIRTATLLEERREVLARVLRTKLSGDDLAKAIAQVEKQKDLATLSRWFDLSLTLSPEALTAELDR